MKSRKVLRVRTVRRLTRAKALCKTTKRSYVTRPTRVYSSKPKYTFVRVQSKSARVCKVRFYRAYGRQHTTQTNVPFISGVIGGMAFIGITAILHAEEPAQKKDDDNANESEGISAPENITLWDKVVGFFAENFSFMINTKPEDWELGDPLPPPHGKEYTLIVSDECLATTQYQATSGGFITKKRPGAEYFLSLSSKQFEIVLFSMQSMTYMPVLDKLDPNRRCTYRLFRDSTSIVNGKEIKDLRLANRDLSKVLVVETDYDNVSHKENTIIVSKYEGANTDVGICEVDHFLKYLAWAKPKDLRPFIKVYQEKGPEFFKRKFQQLQEMHNKKRQSQW